MFLGFRNGFPYAPKGFGLGLAGGDHGVLDQTVIEGPAQDIFQRFPHAVIEPRTGQFDQYILVMRGLEWILDAGDVALAEFEAGPRHQLTGCQSVNKGILEPGKKRHHFVKVRSGGQRRYPGHGGGEQLEDRRRNDTQSSFCANKQVLQVVTRVVLAQSPKAVPKASVGQHHFQSQHQIAGVAVAQHADTTGIGRQVAADLAGAFGPQAERKESPGRGGGLLDIGKNGARFDGDGLVEGIKGTDRLHTAQGQNDAACRYATAAKARIAALRHHRYGSFVTDAHHLCHFLGGSRTHDGVCFPLVQPALFNQVGRHVGGFVDPAFRTDNLPQGIEYRGRNAHQISLPAYAVAVARRKRSLMARPRPVSGTGMTAIPVKSDVSSRRSMENRLAAASVRLPS